MSTVYKHDLTVVSNCLIANDIYELTLTGTDFATVKSGQFINILVDDFYLRRPISVCEVKNDLLVVTYKTFGTGTKKLSTNKRGDILNVLMPLGNGFILPPDNITEVTLVGGGIGTPPLVNWYNYLVNHTTLKINVVLGFNSKEDAIYIDKFKNVEVCYYPTLVTDLLTDNHYIYSCGPTPMINALALKYEGQYLLEERMGCGFGACMGCSKRISENDYKRVCVEGPMFTRSEVVYELKSNNK